MKHTGVTVFLTTIIEMKSSMVSLHKMHKDIIPPEVAVELSLCCQQTLL